MINIAGIVKESIVDGDGIRFVIFEQGCCHNCKGCHNPETHSFYKNKEYSINEIIEMVKENPIIDGVTLSGGDPFFQADKNLELIRKLKELNYNIWVYTGYTWEDFDYYTKNNIEPPNVPKMNNKMIDMLKLCDVLVDGKFKLELKTLNDRFIGSSNQRVINIQESLKRDTIVLYEAEVE